MRRGILILLLAAGAVFGFTLGFGRLWAFQHYGYGYGHGWGPGAHGRYAFEERAADACVRAAERVLNERGKSAPVQPAP
jgi:hypothetical protein